MNGAVSQLEIDQLLSTSRDETAALEERLHAIEQLGERGDAGAIPDLGNLLTSDNPRLRKQAAIALGGIQQPDAIPFLCGALGDAEVEVRQQAVIALGRIRRLDAVDPLGQVLAQDAAVQVREQAALALGDIGGSESIKTLGQALANTNQEASVREQAADALGMIGGEESIQRLVTLLEDGAAGLDLRRRAATVLGATMDDPRAPYALVSSLQENRGQAPHILAAFSENMFGLLVQTLLNSNQEPVRMAVKEVLSDLDRTRTVDALSGILSDSGSPVVHWNAINVLGEIGGQEVVSALRNALLRDWDITLRTSAATALGKVDVPGATEDLWRALLEVSEHDVREAAKTALTKKADWKQKISELVKIFREGIRRHHDIDALALVKAIQPHQSDQQPKQEELIYHLFEHCIPFNQDNRMTAILAEVVIAAAGGNRDQAGEHLNRYQEDHSKTDEELQMLRTYIGGEAAIGPIQRVLKADLKEYFQQPIHDLNLVTRTTWSTTIRYAQYGFLARMAMSVILFCVGLFLVLDTYAAVKAGDFQMEQVWGPAVSLASGLTAMLFSMYRGPLKDIRQSVNDLGVASAAFMAYIHRLLEISHTFSFYYLDQKISFEEMQKSSCLIQEAMQNTIEMLSSKNTATTSGAHSSPQNPQIICPEQGDASAETTITDAGTQPTRPPSD